MQFVRHMSWVTLSQKRYLETRTICYAIRILNKVERKYSNTEKELLAVVWAITKKFWFYVKNKKVKVFTDHKPLVGSCKFTEESRRTVRLWMKLEEFNFELILRAGSDMFAPDKLCRNVAGATEAVPDNRKLIWATHVMLGHQGWKVVLEHLREEKIW
jgi:RNase H-like domain found in reverse transcriptase